MEVIKKAFIDPTDKEKKFVAVQVRFKSSLNSTVSLRDIKNNSQLRDLPLIKQSRLSVMPIILRAGKLF